MHTIAETQQFIIRNFEPEEEEIYLALFDDPEVTLHLPKRNRAENVALFHTALADYEFGNTLGRWGIFNPADQELIGICLLRYFNGHIAQIELGYVLAKKYWGKGLASAMAKILVDYCFKHVNTQEIVAVTTLTNTGSQNVLLKAGLKRVDNLVKDGQELAYFRLGR